MTDEANAPTIPETRTPSSSGSASSPDPRYVLRRVLGQGGMGEVWLAHDGRVDREIAVKLMRGGSQDPELVGRFLREARVQGRLEHPSIVPVHDLGGVDGSAPFFAMKRLTGTTLADVIAGRDEVRWPRRTLLARFVDVCLAVEFAHQRGVVHRDLKPANIMLGDFGEAYVLDWGLARLVGDVDTATMRQSDLRGDSGVGPHTEAGAMLGTPGYMAPEQMRGQEIDRRTDIYALGCILFEILVGAPANPRDRAIDSTLSTLEHRPAKRASDVPPELDDACARATAADVAARLDTAGALADLVQRFLDGDRDLARRRELAISHVTKAQELAAADKRTEAIREAGSAIALDVENTAAQQLLARLLLEPPKELPPAVHEAIREERRESGVAVLRWGTVAYLFFLIGMPFISVFGMRTAWPMALIIAEVAALMLVCLVGVRRRIQITRAFGLAMLAGHCTLLATIGIVLGPFLMTTTLIFGSATIMFTVPSVRFPKTIVFAHLLVVLVPFVLEVVGVLPRTFRLTGTGLHLEPWALDLTPPAFVTMIVGGAFLQLVGNMLVLDAQRTAQVRAEERNHAQKWQLQQLVPSSGSTA